MTISVQYIGSDITSNISPMFIDSMWISQVFCGSKGGLSVSRCLNSMSSRISSPCFGSTILTFLRTGFEFDVCFRLLLIPSLLSPPPPSLLKISLKRPSRESNSFQTKPQQRKTNPNTVAMPTSNSSTATTASVKLIIIALFATALSAHCWRQFAYSSRAIFQGCAPIGNTCLY